jgi:DNA-binding NtrC family response regulator
VVIHGDAPRRGGASYSLQGVDEVQLVRGSRRSAVREIATRLTLSLPGAQLSRRHARLVRVPNGWLVVDDGSRNGTFVEGVRISKHSLAYGCSFECGETLLCLSVDDNTAGVPPDVDSTDQGRLLTTVTPRLLALDHALQQIAPSELPVLITGPSGAGKSHLAEAIHHASGRTGACVRLDVAIREPRAIGDRLKAAADGSLVVENLERFDHALASMLASMLEEAPDVRAIGTTSAAFFSPKRTHQSDLLARLSGYRCALPPLAERRGDLGTLAAATFARLGVEGTMTAEAARALLGYDWPGDLRELEHTLEAAARLAGASSIGVEHLPREMCA